MRAIALVTVSALAIGLSTEVLAWGEPGHEVVGSIATAILEQNAHSNARQRVEVILNDIGQHTLSDAATWADCIRDVKKSGGRFVLEYGKMTPTICKNSFPQSDADEAEAMKSYAANNWSQCDYTTPGGGQCHATYHFEDIPYQHGRYAPDELSTSKHDIVSAMNEAIYFLKNGRSSPGAVVVFKTSREALFVLAHLVGDVHQPLHVGAVYLDGDGHVVDPGHDEALAKKTFTKGGNVIYDGSSGARTPPELHGDWDKIPSRLGTAASPELVAKAQRDVPVDQGNYQDWPAKWASETVSVAKDKAFVGLTYGYKDEKSWTFQAPNGYASTRDSVQELQLERAGVRLARLLTAIWPD